MAEKLRRDRKFYFSWLAKDLTTIIDRMVSPIHSGQLRLLKQLNLVIQGLSRGREAFTTYPKREYWSLDTPELLRTERATQTYQLIDLQAPEDTFPVYGDTIRLYIGNKSYRLDQTKTGKVTSSESSTGGRIMSQDQLVRGAHGFIYFIINNQLYRLHLNAPTKVDPVILPSVFQGKTLHKICTSPVLSCLVIFTLSGTYRYNLVTQKETLLPSYPYIDGSYLDPLTGTLYYVIRKWSDCWDELVLQVIHEDGTLILNAKTEFGLVMETEKASFSIQRCLITLDGQLILQVVIDGSIYNYLYG